MHATKCAKMGGKWVFSDKWSDLPHFLKLKTIHSEIMTKKWAECTEWHDEVEARSAADAGVAAADGGQRSIEGQAVGGRVGRDGWASGQQQETEQTDQKASGQHAGGQPQVDAKAPPPADHAPQPTGGQRASGQQAGGQQRAASKGSSPATKDWATKPYIEHHTNNPTSEPKHKSKLIVLLIIKRDTNKRKTIQGNATSNRC
jgi:hypothetical protein